MKKKTKATGGEGFREPGFWETVKETFLGNAPAARLHPGGGHFALPGPLLLLPPYHPAREMAFA